MRRQKKVSRPAETKPVQPETNIQTVKVTKVNGIPVEWHFAEQPKMIRTKGGNLLTVGVEHSLWPEDSLHRRYYCYGCRKYFSSVKEFRQKHC